MMLRQELPRQMNSTLVFITLPSARQGLQGITTPKNRPPLAGI
jgi:hypothetical protein